MEIVTFLVDKMTGPLVLAGKDAFHCVPILSRTHGGFQKMGTRWNASLPPGNPKYDVAAAPTQGAIGSTSR
jgi:hypothetical protein